MSKKKLLILAASIYQIDAILTAKRLGYTVLTTDNVPGNPGHRLADRAYSVDTTDLEGILRIARDEAIDGIVAPATDVAVEAAAYVAWVLGIPGVGRAAAALLTSKLAFRQFQQAQGLPSPAFVPIAVDHTAPDSLFDGGGWVLKPNRSSGSKGIRIITTAAEFARWCNESCACSSDRQAILERFVSGSQHTCEAFLRHGRVTFSLITDRVTAKRPYTATAGHFTPTSLPENAQQAARDQIAAVCHALGIRDGPIDCDFVVSDTTCTLLELAPRLGGNSLSRLVLAGCDFDIVEAVVRFSCDDLEDGPVQRTRPRPSAIIILAAEAPGNLHFDWAAVRALRNEKWVLSLEVDFEPGTAARAFTNGRDRLGEALIVANSRAELDLRAQTLKQRLAFDIQAIR